jgi:cytochrome c-type biogenesis protein CcmF
LKFEQYTVKIGIKIPIKNDTLYIKSLSFQPTQEEYNRHEHDTGMSIFYDIISQSKDSVYSGETSVGLDGALLYKYPGAVEDLGLRIRLEDDIITKLFTAEENLRYEEHVIKMGTTADMGDISFSLDGFDKNVEQRHYKPKEGDVAIAAKLVFKNKKTGRVTEAKPVYIIQDSQPMSLKYYVGEEGLHVRFSNIDPKTEEFTFKIARDKRPEDLSFSVAIAQNVPRNDYVILQAKVFPGINLFWGGTIMMTFGFLIAWFNKKFSKQKNPSDNSESLT